jgi:hypothetical protein
VTGSIRWQRLLEHWARHRKNRVEERGGKQGNVHRPGEGRLCSRLLNGWVFCVFFFISLVVSILS